MAYDVITLTVPAKSEYARTVRMAAAALVGRTSMNYDDVEDVRMATDEAFVYAAETHEEGEDVRFIFELEGDELRIDVALGAVKADSDDEADREAAYAVFILESVCDEYKFETDEDGAHLKIVKRAGTADGE